MSSTIVNVIKGPEVKAWSLASICVRRPIATAMLFSALIILGLFSWFKIPVELVPALKGEQLHISFYRPSATPEVIENELLLPLERQMQQIAGVSETWGEINGTSGEIHIDFARGYYKPSAELVMQKIVTDIKRLQPQGTTIDLSNKDSTAMSRFVMSVQLIGGDKDYLRALAEQQLQSRLLAISGVSRVFVAGGSSLEAQVTIDLERSTQLGVTPSDIRALLDQAFPGRLLLGEHTARAQQFNVVVRGGVGNIDDIRDLPINANIRLHQVADIQIGSARTNNIFRVNAQDAIGLFIFKQESANLAELGDELRHAIASLEQEYAPYEVSFITGYDASEKIYNLLNRLQLLGLSGFAVALLVLYLLIRQFRAVSVVAISVPLSLLISVSLLYLTGNSLNMITLFGLTIGVGMLVDNSIVVYEAVLRCLERGYSPKQAASAGVKRTWRAIATASITNAIVFLPLIYFTEDAILRQVIALIAIAIVIPLFASLFVATTIVPVLTERVAARTLGAIGPDSKKQSRRIEPVQVMFSAGLKVFLRRPTSWLNALFCVSLLTVIIALPALFSRGLNSDNAYSQEIAVDLSFTGGSTLANTSRLMSRIEHMLKEMKGVSRVESNFNNKEGTLAVYMSTATENSDRNNHINVKQKIDDYISLNDSIELKQTTGSSSIEQRLASTASHRVSISGYNMSDIYTVASEVVSRLESIPQLQDVSLSMLERGEEVTLGLASTQLVQYKSYTSQVLNVFTHSGIEGKQLDATLSMNNGHQLPIVVYYKDDMPDLEQHLNRFRYMQNDHAIGLDDVVSKEVEPAAPSISHRNGRREALVTYQFKSGTPVSGPEYEALKAKIDHALNDIHLSAGYRIESLPAMEASNNTQLYLVSVIILLYIVLAISFESMLLPALVLVALPLCVIGSVWALLLSGLGMDLMVLVGIVVLMGLSVNPAVLLVDRMQRLVHQQHISVARAAMIAVKERARPVLMAACTTFFGLWPMAISKGVENEIWPSFATAVMGGILSSAILTLLVIPVLFFLMTSVTHKVQLLGQQKVWLLTLVTFVFTTLLTYVTELSQIHWQVICAFMISSLTYFVFTRYVGKAKATKEQPCDADTLASIEARFLSKSYGEPGVIGAAWARCQTAGRKTPRTITESKRRALTYFSVAIGACSLTLSVQNKVWYVLFALIALLAFARFTLNLLLSLNVIAISETQKISAIEHNINRFGPWLLILLLFFVDWLYPKVSNALVYLQPTAFTMLVLVLALTQYGRRLAREILSGRMAYEIEGVRWAWFVNLTRTIAVNIFGIGFKQHQFEALRSVNFVANKGMIGLLGPNGAGKSTFLRLLAGVLEPSKGTMWYGGIRSINTGPDLSSLVGYLPQEFGLYSYLTCKEYLDYFALLYKVQSPSDRVNRIVKDVGLTDKQHETISSLSGGMRQRVGIARALLRMPPIIIVDEPTVGLDPYERIKLRNLLASLAKERVVLFSTHVIEDVEVSCDRVMILKKGSLVYDGLPQNLSHLANNQVWQLRVNTNEAEEIAKQVKVVNQINDGMDTVFMRVLSNSQPHSNATIEVPNLEDGYLQFFMDYEECQNA